MSDTLSAGNNTFDYTGTIETVTVEQTGTYAITAYGAEGGSAAGESGGLGAEISGDLVLTQGETIEILVGGEGGGGGEDGGGGGGGSFVVEVDGSSLTPLVVAGGGGGGGGNYSGLPGQTTHDGNSGGSGRGYGDGGGGGGGFAGNGTSDGGGGGGSGFAGGGAGGGSGEFPAGSGGFGGGGAGGGIYGGGGGGYSGGAGGDASGGYGGGSFYASGATDVSETSGVAAPDADDNGLIEIDLVSCFLEGTLITTPDGEKSVESLTIGDAVSLAEGGLAPIQWIGRRTLYANGPGGYRYADPLLYMPIRIKSGALGENQPRRDLFLTQEHAVLVGDVLVQAGALVNGTSVTRQVQLPERFTFYHIELERHALILAEGMAAESFVDNVDRHGFDNWEEYEALYPDRVGIVEMPLPRVQSLRQMPLPLRRMLRERAQTLLAVESRAAQPAAA